MSKKRESVTENTPDDDPIAAVVEETEEVVAEPDVTLDDIHRVYYSSLADAKRAGSLEGDAAAIAYRAARTWARENNRRMPDTFGDAER